jgi:molecular chaperone DnaK
MGRSVGIDFGTSTTVVAIADENGVTVLRDESGPVVPSVVSFPPSGGELIGEKAKARRVIDAQNTPHSFKRIIGKAWDAPVVDAFAKKYPFKLEQQGILPHFVTRAGSLSAIQLCSRLMRRAFELAQAAGGAEGTAIVALPVEYDEIQRESTIEAAKMAGFTRVDEPLAIVRAYLHTHAITSGRIVAYDLGGGTFDVAVCDVKEKRLAILATAGDPYLGGDDIDLALADWLCEEVLKSYGWDFRTSPQSMARVVDQCERAKIELSTTQEVHIDLSAIEPNDVLQGKKLTLHRGLLQKRCIDLVRRSFGICDHAFAKAGLSPRDESVQIFLAGGCSRIPFISNLVGHYFGKQPTCSDVPEHLVAIGAALIARGVNARPDQRVAARRSTRVACAVWVDVGLKSGGDPQRVIAADMSPGGMFVHMATPPAVGAELNLRFGIGDKFVFAVTGKVVRVIPSDGSSAQPLAGVGVEFGMMIDAQKQRLDAVLQQIAASLGPTKPEERALPIGSERSS